MYAANQEVNTVKSPQNFVDITANEVLNISSVQGFKFVQTKSSSKGFFSSSVNINTKATAKDAYSAYQQDLAQQQAQLQDLQAKLEDDIGFIEQIDIDEMSELVGDLQADKKYYQNQYRPSSIQPSSQNHRPCRPTSNSSSKLRHLWL
ncbi:hypothetical protein BSPWISOXPB_7377 [uncultured Gammaproteobacteria bacterium]|nr:hypothetical protein BSPWISOXPB_7377 [uncultured Gammaproteobacteria bacterium]